MIKAVLICLGAMVSFPATADTLIAMRLLPAQSIIAAEDVAVVAGETAGAFRAQKDVEGRETSTIIYAGQALMHAQVKPAALVDRNQLVTLVFFSGGLRIAAQGRSLERKAFGEPVRAMNLLSKTTVAGIVQEDGSILVGWQK